MDRPRAPRWTFSLNTPGIGSALACIRSFSTLRGEKVPEGGMRGQPARQECFVSHPDKRRVPFALTPTLSHSHAGSASRESFGGRGGDARRCRWVSHFLLLHSLGPRPLGARPQATTAMGSQRPWLGQQPCPVTIGSLRTNGIRRGHVLKGHSWIAQGSCAALPWVAGQCRKSALKGLA
jgi:hypothetical protein